MPKIIDPAVRAEALRLRLEERLSLKEIQARLAQPVAKGTLSIWLRAHPLTEQERLVRARAGVERTRAWLAEDPARRRAIYEKRRVNRYWRLGLGRRSE